ncbi:MFS transporter [Parvularcula oceani]|uniref:MFS transporter n=1 Tax=Parvularcula oceani TaxID=1247963 RepID=UPI00055BC590|nr:MFS transporter [Parvularcula oceani]
MTSAQSFGAIYAALFLFLGVQLPFLPGWLDARGFDAAAIGLLSGGALVLRLLLAPALAYRAESARDPRTPLRLVALGLFLSAILLLFDVPPSVIAMDAILLLFLFGLAMPLIDAGVLRADRAGKLVYGRTRGIGSAAFIVANLAGGAVITAGGDGAVIVWLASTGLLLFLSTLMLPPAPQPAEGRERPNLKEAGRLFRSRSFLLMLFASGLCQGSHAVYYTFSELHWSALGYSSLLIGVLWTVGVLVEIVVLLRGRALLTRIDPAMLIALGCLGAVLRWPLTGLSPPLPVLFLLQVGHALTFTATYLGTIEFVGRAVPETYQSTAMTVISTLGIGAMTGGAAMLAGQIFEPEAPFLAYLGMGGMGAVGLGLALALRARWDGTTAPRLAAQAAKG